MSTTGISSPLRTVRADDESRPLSTLAAALGPLTPAEFRREHWGRWPVHVSRNRPDLARELLTSADLERHFAVDDFFLRNDVATPRRTPGPPAPPPRAPSDVYRQLQEGSSLRVRRLESFLDPANAAVRLLRDMETELGVSSDSLSCYVAPAGAVGLGPHHDETEILTVQVEGSKGWRLFHRVSAMEPGLHESADLGDPTAELVLQPGDVLYVPSGWVHDVTNDEPSFSLTYVLQPLRWRLLVELLAERLARTASLSTPVLAGPDPVGPEARSQLAAELEQAMCDVVRALADIDVDAVLGEVRRRRVLRAQPLPEAHLPHALHVQAMTLQTRLRGRGAQHVLVRRGAVVELVLPGGEALRAAAAAEPALRDVLATQEDFRVADMHPTLGPAAKLALARQLVTSGVLQVVTEPDAHARA